MGDIGPERAHFDVLPTHLEVLPSAANQPAAPTERDRVEPEPADVEAVPGR